MEAVDESVLLCEEIVRISGGKDSLRFGDLMEDEKVEQTFEAIMGTLKAARKRGLIEFEGELLLKGQSDDVIIKLASEANKENKENETVENKENETVEVVSDVAKQFLVEVPVEAISGQEAEQVVAVEPPATTEDNTEVAVEPPPSTEEKAQEQDPVAPSSSTTSLPIAPSSSITSAEDKEKRWAVDTSYVDRRTADLSNLEPRRGETAVVGDSTLLARSTSKTDDGKWQSVDTSYIDRRTQDTSNLAGRQTGDKAVVPSDAISSGTVKGDDGKWTVNTSYIKDRTADTSNLESRKSQNNIGSVASTLTKRKSGGKWEVDTSYIGYRTADAALVRSKEEKDDKTNYEDPAEKQYSYEEITQDKRPAGIDPSKKEAYLTDADFQTVMGVTRVEFAQMAKWKQQNMKKAKNLF